MAGKPSYRAETSITSAKGTGVPKAGRPAPKKPSPDAGGLEPQPET